MKNSVFFLHIPKTAGTTINKAFKPVFKESRFFDHCESRNPELIRELKVTDEPFFASGHLRFVHCSEFIANPKVFSMTVLRKPEQQLQSHLNWVRAYGAPDAGARRRMIEPAIAELSLKLWDIDFNDICEMAEVLSQPVAMALFDNMQTRYLRHGNPSFPVSSACLDSAIATFSSFDLIFVLDDYPSAMKFLSKQFIGIKDEDPQNVQINKQVIYFDNKEVARFYEKFISSDRELVKILKMKSRYSLFQRMNG